MERVTSSLPAAVLWDMDGTIVDTEPYWMASEVELVERFGGTWTHEQALGMVGLGLHDAAVILQGAGVDLTAEQIIEFLTGRVMTLLRERGNPFRPGARELLRELRENGVKTALVTMSLRKMTEIVIGQIPFEAFDVVIAGDDATRPKPHPDPYLQAADALGVDIAETVAIEDSPNGLRSALASGAVTVGVPHMVPLDGLGAHAVWSSLDGVTASDIATLAHANRPAGSPAS